MKAHEMLSPYTLPLGIAKAACSQHTGKTALTCFE
jgi:hypothetical protein